MIIDQSRILRGFHPTGSISFAQLRAITKDWFHPLRWLKLHGLVENGKPGVFKLTARGVGALAKLIQEDLINPSP
jgi:hypothetical protein